MEAEAHDDRAIRKVEFRINYQGKWHIVEATDYKGESRWAATWDVSDKVEEEVQVQAFAYDFGNNPPAISGAHSVQIDRTPPHIVSLQQPNSNTTVANQLHMEAEVHDHHGVGRVIFKVDYLGEWLDVEG